VIVPAVTAAALRRPTRRRVVNGRTPGRTGVTVTALGFAAAPISNLYRPLAEPDALAAVNAA
jgi:D-threo-aldose 1-dehydrogenase